jgi:membrane-associated phospholipid phosphatase
MIEIRLETPRLSRTLETLLQRIQEWDDRVIRRVVNRRPQNPTHPTNRAMRALTRSGDADTWTIVVVGLFMAGGAFREAAITRVPGLLLTLLVTHILKRLVRRNRPSVRMPDLARLLGNPDEFSFPSSHSACAWAMCAGLSLHQPMIAPVLIPLAAGISWSRIHVGAHYLSDILTGSAIGIAIALIIEGIKITLTY